MQPRSWKYESDDLNRRVRREGSIERREDVAEKEISPSDVRRKLAKRLLPIPHSKRGSKGKPEDDDPSELPPSPPTTTAHSTSVTVTTDKQKREKTVVVETAPSKQPKGSTPSKASTPSSEVPTVVSTPSLSNVPLGPSLSSSDGPAAATGGEESEAKLRERLIERAKRFRTVVKETQNVATVTESQKTVQVQYMQHHVLCYCMLSVSVYAYFWVAGFVTFLFTSFFFSFSVLLVCYVNSCVLII